MSWSHLLELKDAEEIMVRFFYALIFSSVSQANCGSLIATGAPPAVFLDYCYYY